MNNTYTELKCTIMDYEGQVRSVIVTEPAWDMTITDMDEMFKRLLAGMGFSEKQIEDYFSEEEK